MTIHLRQNGVWATCQSGSDCTDKIHVEMTLEEAEQVPEHILLQLIEAFDPPTLTPRVMEYTSKQTGHRIMKRVVVKEWRDNLGQLHRDYGLPAVIWPNGKQEHWVHGANHDYDDWDYDAG